MATAAVTRASRPALGAREWVLLGVLSTLWGGGYFFIGVAVAEIPPFTLVLGRVALASMALMAYVHWRGERMPTSPRLWRAFFVMGTLNGLVPYTLIVWAQTQIASGLASVLNSTTPLFSVVLAHGFTSDERMTPARAAGALLGLVGVFALTGPDALHGMGMRGHELGQLAVLGAAFSYACAGIYGRRFKDVSPAVAAAGQVTGTAALVLPLALLLEQPWILRPSGLAVGALVGLGLVSTAAAYLLFFRILAVAGATNVMLVTFLVPVTALLLGTLLLGERPDWNVLVGFVLITAGILAIDERLLSRRRALGLRCRTP